MILALPGVGSTLFRGGCLYLYPNGLEWVALSILLACEIRARLFSCIVVFFELAERSYSLILPSGI